MVKDYWVTWRTPSGNNNHNLLKQEILDYLGVDPRDIKSIYPFVSTPDQPFTVPGLARPKHPLCISGGIKVELSGNREFCVEELYYTDLSGHRYGLWKGKRHFNLEYRITDVSGNVEIFNGQHDPYNILEDHVIKNARYIELRLPPPAGQTGDPIVKKICIPPKNKL